MIFKIGKYEVEAVCFEDDSDNSAFMVCDEKDAVLFSLYKRNRENFAIHIQDFKVKENAISVLFHYAMSENKEKTFKELWENLGDIPINEEEEIDQDWFIFPKGTYRESIWHWFEDAFCITLGEIM